jgi:hypothetical protein
MYTINKNFGIGTVQNIENGKVTVYFQEEDLTKILLENFTTIYSTYQAAILALDPEMTEEEANARYSDIVEEERIRIEGAKAQLWLEETNREAAINLIRN